LPARPFQNGKKSRGACPHLGQAGAGAPFSNFVPSPDRYGLKTTALRHENNTNTHRPAPSPEGFEINPCLRAGETPDQLIRERQDKGNRASAVLVRDHPARVVQWHHLFHHVFQNNDCPRAKPIASSTREQKGRCTVGFILKNVRRSARREPAKQCHQMTVVTCIRLILPVSAQSAPVRQINSGTKAAPWTTIKHCKSVPQRP